MNFNELSFFSNLRKIYQRLSPIQRRKALWVFLTTLINGFLDVIGIALIIPIIYLINDSPKIHSNKYLEHLFRTFDFKDDTSFLLFFITAITIIFVVKNIISLVFNYIQEKFIYQIGKQITIRQYKQYLLKDYLHIANVNSNQLVQEVARVPMEFARNILSPTFFIATEYFVFLFVIIGVLFYDFKVVFLLAITLTPIVYLLNKATKNKINHYGHVRHSMQIRTFKEILESLHAYIDVKLSNSEEFFLNKNNKTLAQYFSVMTKLGVLQKVPVRLIETATVFGIAVLFFFVNYWLHEPSKIVSILILFATAAYRLLPSLNRILTANMQIKGSSYVFDILKAFKRGDDLEWNKKYTSVNFSESIELSNVYFKYPEKDKYALEKINLEIKKGATVGLIGESGSGKSTLGKLLLRLIQEERGEFKIDGKPMDKSDVCGWNDLVGYVQQDFYLLDASLAENIAFGFDENEIDYEKIDKVIEQVQLKEVVQGLKQGIYTPIGEFGGKLSGGQRQRIAIARALYKEAQILLFDEATSALDGETEHAIMKTLYGLKELNLTLIIIAHRITTLENCDLIFEMDKGRVKETLTYKELFAR